MNDRDLDQIEALFGSLNTQREFRRLLSEKGTFDLSKRGLPTETILTFVEGSNYHTKFLKVIDEGIEELKGLIKEEIKSMVKRK